MSREHSFCRQEAGAASDDLPARFRAARLLAVAPHQENVPLARVTEARGSGGGCNDGRDDREERGSGERETARLYVPADTFIALKQPLISGGESRIQPSRICLHVPREDGGGGGDQGDERGMESMRSLYSARQKRLVRYTP